MPKLAFVSLLIVLLLVSGCDSYSPTSPSSIGRAGENSNTVEAVKDIFSPGSPGPSIGVELSTLRGWFANLYPWMYLPDQSTVHPSSQLWTPGYRPSSFQVATQCRQIRDFGGGAAVLEYSPNPKASDNSYWLKSNFAIGCGPFFVLYEHIFGTRFIPADGGPKNMDDPYNRKVFKEDIEFIFKNVIVPNQSRYITVDGRPVIYLWATTQMIGDFASLIEEVKKDYPVFFLGSESHPNDAEDVARIKALDGFMQYSLGGRSDYLHTVQDYNRISLSWRQYLRGLEVETGKRHIFIPTFQAAYDDSKVIPKRSNPVMYARSRDEVKYHAEMIRSGMGSVYDFSAGPFVVYGELFEGAAVIESQCLPATLDSPGRYVGCGTARLEILKEYFGW